MSIIRKRGLPILAFTITSFFYYNHFSQAEYSIPLNIKEESSKQIFNEKDFIIKAYSGGMMEAKLGKAAQIQSDNRRVKDYGFMMDHDHTLANDELKNIAENKNIPLPDRLDDAHQNDVNMLKNKSVGDFDNAYIKMMVADHMADIKEFEEAAGKVSDAQLKSFVKKMQPMLKIHLDSAIAIQKSLK